MLVIRGMVGASFYVLVGIIAALVVTGIIRVAGYRLWVVCFVQKIFWNRIIIPFNIM